MKEQEKELRSLLLFTETKASRIKIEVIDLVENDTNMDTDEDMGAVKPLDSVSQPIIIQPCLSTNDSTKLAPPVPPGDNVKRSKPIIVRVVKRVPFLKSKLAAPAQLDKPTTAIKMKPTTTTIKSTTAAISERPSRVKTRQKAADKRLTDPGQSDDVPNDDIPIKCEYCGTVFSHITLLQVINNSKCCATERQK